MGGRPKITAPLQGKLPFQAVWLWSDLCLHSSPGGGKRYSPRTNVEGSHRTSGPFLGRNWHWRQDCLSSLSPCLIDRQGHEAEAFCLEDKFLAADSRINLSTVLRIQILEECVFSAHRKLILEECLFLKKMVSEGLVSRPFLTPDAKESRLSRQLLVIFGNGLSGEKLSGWNTRLALHLIHGETLSPAANPYIWSSSLLAVLFLA